MVHRAAEVADDDVPGLDHTGSRLVVRAGAVGAGPHDGEVGPLVAGVEHALHELTVHVGFAAPGERADAHLLHDAVDRARRSAQRVDLRRVLHHA